MGMLMVPEFVDDVCALPDPNELWLNSKTYAGLDEVNQACVGEELKDLFESHPPPGMSGFRILNEVVDTEDEGIPT